MKSVVFKIVSSFMALLVLFSTLSFTLDMHFCGDVLVETAIFKKAKGCGMEMDNPVSNTCELTKKNCCSEQQSLICGQDELQISAHEIAVGENVFIAAFFQTYSQLFKTSNNQVSNFTAHAPPMVVRSIYKLDESYLI